MELKLIGIGSGVQTLTRAAEEAIRNADLLIGAERMLLECRMLQKEGARSEADIFPDSIIEKIERAEAERIVVLYSGDSGFYSGAAGLSERLKERDIAFSLLPGISSVQLLAAALQEPWESWHLVSVHGREIDPVELLMREQDTFFLTDERRSPAAICAAIREAGLPHVEAVVGEKLGTGEAALTYGTVEALSKMRFFPLSVLLVRRSMV